MAATELDRSALRVFDVIYPDDQLNKHTSQKFVAALQTLAGHVAGKFSEGPKQRGGGRIAGGIDFSKYHSRYIALELAYLGWDYHGFASQNGGAVETIEASLFRALKHTCLVPNDSTWQTLQYSRCGRTDKGVSAVGQVVALRIRSQGKAGQAMAQPHEEIDYPLVLNRALPDDIKVLGWADVAPTFSARFSTVHREYKYHMVQDGSLDIEAMQQAARHLHGEHDFRNFCKLDAGRVTTFKRTVLSCTIEPIADCVMGMRHLLVLHIVGTAFLWHQVRCIAAVLLMVGHGKETPDVVQRMLDVTATPCKPQYSLAAEEPLLLSACAYNDMHWYRSPQTCLRVNAAVQALLHRNMLGTAVLYNIHERVQSNIRSVLECAQTQRQTSHICLLQRATEPLVEERMHQAARLPAPSLSEAAGLPDWRPP